MSIHHHARRQRLLRHAEGYLELGSVFGDRWRVPRKLRDRMARRCLTTLNRLDRLGKRLPGALYLRGRALLTLQRFDDAVLSLNQAAERDPEDYHSRLALGWCYKRLGRLDMAIRSLEEALQIDASRSIIHYNLACYWSLADRPTRSLKHLAMSFELNPSLRDKVAAEADFDPIRHHAEFQALTSVIV